MFYHGQNEGIIRGGHCRDNFSTVLYRCDYCQLGSSNTYCLYGGSDQPGRSCGNEVEVGQGVTDNDIRDILRIHNDYRR